MPFREGRLSQTKMAIGSFKKVFNYLRACPILNIFLHSWILYLVGFGAAAFLFFKGAIALAILSLMAPFGLLAFIEPHIFFYSTLAKKYRMHPKYAFFKRFYGYEFPFEEVIKNKIV